MANRFKVLGINDDRNFCECCGKSGLQRVVWIEDTETGEVKHFGTSCAAKPAKGFDCTNEIKEAIKSVTRKIKNIEIRHSYKALGGKWLLHPTEKHTLVVADGPLWDKLYNAELAKIYAEAR